MDIDTSLFTENNLISSKIVLFHLKLHFYLLNFQNSRILVYWRIFLVFRLFCSYFSCHSIIIKGSHLKNNPKYSKGKNNSSTDDFESIRVVKVNVKEISNVKHERTFQLSRYQLKNKEQKGSKYIKFKAVLPKIFIPDEQRITY